jgi:hypothetical protein
MANNSKKARSGPQNGIEAPAERVLQATPANTVKKLLKDLRGQAEDIAEIRGEMGAAVKDAVDNKHLHKKAFADVRRLDKLSAEKLADHLDHFLYYLDVTGLSDRAKSAQRLPGTVKDPAEAEEEEGAPAERAGDGEGAGLTH